MIHPDEHILSFQLKTVIICFNRWQATSPLFTAACSTSTAYDGVYVESSEEARRPELLDFSRICLFGGGRGPRYAHGQAPTAAAPWIKSQGS